MKKEEQIAIIKEAHRQVCLSVAVAAGIFTLIIGGLLLYNQQQLNIINPLDNMHLAKMKKDHQSQPQNEHLKTSLREYDLKIRQDYFDRLEFKHNGSYFLVGSLALMMLMLHLGDRGNINASYNKNSFNTNPDKNRTARSFACMAVALFGVIVLVAGSYNTKTPIQKTEQHIRTNNQDNKADKSADQIIPAEYHPTKAEWIKNWPCFRGPLQNGTVPTDLSEYNTAKTGKILWKSKIPKTGMNSPIVWGNKVFVSGASSHDKEEIYCYSTEDGTMLWAAKIPPASGDIQKRLESAGEAGFAAPTMATDGKRVCAIFATGDLACVDTEGKFIWSKNLGVPENHYGYASSLAYHNGIIFVQWDNSGNKYLFAFNIANGRELWKAPRHGEMSWSSPVILNAGTGEQLVAMAAPTAISYDPANGKELWKCKTLMGEVAPSASSNGKSFFLAMQYSNLSAIRPDGSGDITKSHVVWQYPDNIPDTSSPLATETYVIISDSTGIITCLDAQNGKLKWEQSYDTIFYPSPTLIGKHVYQLDNKGMLRIFSPIPKFKLTANMEFGETGGASPAIANGRIFIRGSNHLFCIGMEKK